MSVLRSPISPIFDARVVICVSFVIAKRSERALTRKIVGYNGGAFSRGCRGVAQPGSAPALGARKPGLFALPFLTTFPKKQQLGESALRSKQISRDGF